MITHFLRKRLPAKENIFTVFSFVIFIVASWSIYFFLPNLNSYVYHFTTLEILSIFLYLMAFALFESILVTGVLLVIGFILPRQWFREGFVYKAPIPVVGLAFALMRLQSSISNDNIPRPHTIAEATFVFLILCVLLILLINRMRKLQQLLRVVLEQFTVFAYLYVPLGLIGVVVILIRNGSR